MVQIFEMSDDDAQRVVGGLLSGVKGIAVDLAFNGPDRFLVVDCESAAQAIAVQRFVIAIDPHAVVIRTATKSREPSEVAVTA